jgi:hypothetical protein
MDKLKNIFANKMVSKIIISTQNIAA